MQVLSERAKGGLTAAHARGKKGGRPKGSFNKTKPTASVTSYRGELSVSEITGTLQISRSTLYQYLRNEGVK